MGTQSSRSSATGANLTPLGTPVRMASPPAPLTATAKANAPAPAGLVPTGRDVASKMDVDAVDDKLTKAKKDEKKRKSKVAVDGTSEAVDNAEVGTEMKEGGGGKEKEDWKLKRDQKKKRKVEVTDGGSGDVINGLTNGVAAAVRSWSAVTSSLCVLIHFHFSQGHRHV